ncbi:CubicO group peptidase (beta-lactamase class C family) [Actinoplanes lutulentus]|uniref:CubicO group peptidase (Beta-lactamase class C family) n=1 Tax=Actinoplanes lutulentus TaxID=1287878 RepID=A0A327ZC88_9ACTN|nr:serine hydrolase domain-containing protein [Actinoplanes lutulentus]MBB2941430.1 CubicO group peptidase (beta-lactamase class C family) [Actinoplanes lutulentus]RAK36921.1 CubicO group peptidase (beta-lactamase class C family) [Actinoplanes lutulentus]
MSLLAETTRRIDEIAARAQSTGRVPSLALAVVRDRAVLHFAAAGEQPRPDQKTQYRLGSITKTITATLVMQLRDEGFFALDDLLYRHLPGTPIGDVTLRQLLGHVSGLQREPDGLWWERNPGGDVESLLAGLTYEKVAGAPFRRFRYSNLAYGLLGAVLERVTGQTWAELAGKRVLDPLGMKRTTYAPVEPYARGYVVHDLGGALHEEPRPDTGAMAPAGQLWSTVTDMAKWAGFLADPAPGVLSRETVDEMCAPVVIGDLESWTVGHGLGPQLFRVGERVFVGHGGSMPGYVAHLAVHRRSRLGVIAFANAYGLTGDHIREVALRALTTAVDAEPERVAVWRPPVVPVGEAAELCGRWWWMGNEYEVVPDGSALVMTGPWHRTRFVQEAPDRWRGVAGNNEGEVLAVLRGGDGDVGALDIATFVYRREPGHLA